MSLGINPNIRGLNIYASLFLLSMHETVGSVVSRAQSIKVPHTREKDNKGNILRFGEIRKDVSIIGSITDPAQAQFDHHS